MRACGYESATETQRRRERGESETQRWACVCALTRVDGRWRGGEASPAVTSTYGESTPYRTPHPTPHTPHGASHCDVTAHESYTTLVTRTLVGLTLSFDMVYFYYTYYLL